MEEKVNKPTLVISGINLVDGGALSVYLDCLKELNKYKYDDAYNVIALVGDRSLFPEYPKIQYIEFPKSKKNWLFRMYYEYFYFKRFSKKNNVDIWLSLHDTTPNVVARKRFVYCHNPSPFNSMKISEIKYGWKYYLFSKFYKYLYKINIHKNNAVIVQQEWMRNEFERMFNIKNVIVARPSFPKSVENQSSSSYDTPRNQKIFVYPSYPRYYKNFEVVCCAAKKLEESGINNFKVFITVDGTENNYSKELVQKYSNLKTITFCGLLSRDKLFELYSKSSALLFMSKLETWGMPIIEFKPTNKPMILSDLPYSHETVGDYDDVAFVNPDDYQGLAKLIKKVINDEKLGSNKQVEVKPPFANDWRELFSIIFN